MKLFKNALSLIIISILLLYNIEISAYASPNANSQNQVKIAVFLSNFNSPFISSLKKDLEAVEKENKIESCLHSLIQKVMKLFKIKILMSHLIRTLICLW